MNNSDMMNANRIMWNETADAHASGYVETLYQAVAAPDFSTFDKVEQTFFAQIGLAGKSVAQLACNNGRELISIKKAGAGYCAGFDFSDQFIEQAKQLALAGNVDVDFICANVYDMSPEYDDKFDLVYITIGVLGWLPDLEAFFAMVARLLKAHGQLFIYEMHPVLNMYDANKGHHAEYSYFRTEPICEENEPDYMDPTNLIAAPSYWFPHKLADIIGACLKFGMTITHFDEYAHDISMVYADFERFEKKPPLSFSLVANRTR